jgi:pimeloyl-ACP methyl ester carboxylesterase
VKIVIGDGNSGIWNDFIVANYIKATDGPSGLVFDFNFMN